MIKKSKTIEIKTNFFSMTISTRKIFWIVLLTETLKSEFWKSRIIERKITKSEKKKIKTMNKRHLQEFEKNKQKSDVN